MSTKQTLEERLKKTVMAMRRTEPDSGIDLCHIVAVEEAIAALEAENERLRADAKAISLLHPEEKIMREFDGWSAYCLDVVACVEDIPHFPTPLEAVTWLRSYRAALAPAAGG